MRRYRGDRVGQANCVKNHLAENDWGGFTVTEFRGSHGMEEGKGEIYLASGRQYGNALLGVRHQEEEVAIDTILSFVCLSV